MLLKLREEASDAGKQREEYAMKSRTVEEKLKKLQKKVKEESVKSHKSDPIVRFVVE